MHTNGTAMRLDASRTADVLAWLRKVAGRYGGLNPRQPEGDQLKTSIFKGTKPGALQRFTLPKPHGRRAFEVIGIPLREPGFYAVELESPRLGAALPEQPRDPVGQHARLAGPSPGDDQQRAALVHHGLPLLRVESFQQRLRVG